MAKPRCANCGGEAWAKDGRCRACREFPTLGYLVAEWMQANCVIPDGDRKGEPYVPTDEQLRYLLRHYRISPLTKRDKKTSRWTLPFVYYRGSQLVRPQKWGKGPLAAAMCCVEGAPDGPVFFDGWDADGQPVGRPWATPWIQVTAVSENQTDNIWKALQPMIELGALSADIPDTGLTRINLPSGGIIEPVTSSARSRLGQRITFAPQDETHSWVKANGGHQLAQNQRRNLAGVGGRFASHTNAWDPAEDSIAQRLAESKTPGVYHDDAEPPEGSVRNKAERRKVMRKVYGDSAWVDLDRIDGEIVALLGEGEGAQAERFFLNRKKAGESRAFDIKRWNEIAAPQDIPAGSTIVIGVDGARFNDAIAVVATHVASGYQWPLKIIERPKDAPEDYEHSYSEVDGAISDAWSTFYVWRAYVDEQFIEEWADRWIGRWGEKRVVVWRTNRPRQIVWAVREYTTAINSGPLSHDGDPMFAAHIRNAIKKPETVRDDKGVAMHSIQKDRHDSPRKIDAAMAGVLSWEARGDAIAAGVSENPEPLVTWR